MVWFDVAIVGIHKDPLSTLYCKNVHQIGKNKITKVYHQKKKEKERQVNF